jgi:hypothetical protein
VLGIENSPYFAIYASYLIVDGTVEELTNRDTSNDPGIHLLIQEQIPTISTIFVTWAIILWDLKIYSPGAILPKARRCAIAITIWS